MSRKTVNATALGLAWMASLGVVFVLGILSAFTLHLGPGAAGGQTDLSLSQRLAMLVIERYTGEPADIAAIMEVGGGSDVPGQLDQTVRGILRQSDPGQRERAAILLVEGLPSRQVMGMIKLLQEILPHPARDQVLGIFLESWAIEDGRRAMVFANSLSASVERELAIEAVLRGWSRMRPEEAWAWAIESSGTGGRAERWLSLIVSSLGSVDRSTAFQLLEQMPESDFRNDMARLVMDQLLFNETPREAIDWLGEFPGESVVSAAAALARHWARSEPQAATQWLHRSYPSEVTALMAPLGEWVYDDPPGAMDWIWQTFSGSQRRELLEASADEWLANDGPAPLANWLNARGSHPQLDGVIAQLAIQTADYDPATAMVWAQSVINEDNRDMLEILIGRRWIEMAPQDAENRLPQYIQGDAARSALLERVPVEDARAPETEEAEPPVQ